jgi:hypothetical protein
MHANEGYSGTFSEICEALRQWIYEPTLLDGRPVEVVTTVDDFR